MLADLFITTKNRPDLLRKSLHSLEECTARDQFRLTVVHDGSDTETRQLLDQEFFFFKDHLISHSVNQGLGPSINQALSHIDALKKWDVTPVPLTVYVQDDVIYTHGWLEKLSQKYIQLYHPLKLGFASGHDAVEHRDDPRAQLRRYGENYYTSRYIRATMMMAHHSYWMSMWPIPRIDPETGIERGRPHDGLGSGVDWWFIRNAAHSVCNTNRTNLVMPGLVVHAGYNDSTWLKRELPESESDKLIANPPKPPPKFVPCYGICPEPKPLVPEHTFCDSCKADWAEDREAFK